MPRKKKEDTNIFEYYSLTNILKENATYYMIIGERSNGKTYSVLEHSLREFCTNGRQLAIIRRWDDELKGKRAQQMFDGLIANGLVVKYTQGEWTTIVHQSGRWFLARKDEKLDRMVLDITPFAFRFSINTAEHDKSTAYPMVYNILFDEFITRGQYLPDEFVSYMNLLSTIIRDRDGVKIFMCANTVNKYCPYFKEMGLRNIDKMKQGTIDTYEYGETGLKVAVEYAKTNNKGKKSDKYFAFDNPKLEMITNGKWEIAIYPHCPIKYTREDIIFYYFILFEKHILQCEIVNKDGVAFTFIHEKTTPIQNDDRDIIFSQEYSHKPNHFRKITKPKSDLERKIWWFFAYDRVFYSDNEVGELVRNYLNWSKADLGIL